MGGKLITTMTTWDKEMQIETVNQMLITLSIISIREKSAADDKVIDYKEAILQYIRTLVELAEAHGALNEVRNNQ